MNGFFDLQVNGYHGVDFNSDDLSPEALHHACRGLRDDGVAAILATIITEEFDVMKRRIQRLVELRERDDVVREVIGGIHIEGPFLNETAGYRGAHPPDAMQPATPEAAQELLEAGSGLVRLVTLAPERDEGCQTTRYLTDNGVKVAAGHCDASLEVLDAACDAGLSLFTHLGNGCPMQMNRHDNIIQRALSRSERLWLCFIADGAHVPFFALKNYLRAAGLARCCIVTDAIAPAGLGPGRYTLSRWTLDIGADMVARSPDGSHLVGAAITMPQSAANLQQHLGLTADEIQQLTAINPRRALQL
jgi:N-acetylglucosamine-6-phosphate deacetylase